MKRKILIIFIALACLSINVQHVCAGANSKAHEQANENAIFNRVGDWFATIGKSKEEKAQIIEDRRLDRAVKKAEKMKKDARMQMKKSSHQKGS